MQSPVGAWLALLLAMLANVVASLVARPALWVTTPVTVYLVWHYYRVIRQPRP